MTTENNQQGYQGPGCEEIQNNLMDYLTRDLGEARSNLIREHLRKCDKCQAEARELQETINLLRGASGSESIPRRMSRKTRDRMMRAVEHPFLDWIYRHHICISLCIAIIAVIVLFVSIKDVRIWNKPDWGSLRTVFIGDNSKSGSEENEEEPVIDGELQEKNNE